MFGYDGTTGCLPTYLNDKQGAASFRGKYGYGYGGRYGGYGYGGLGYGGFGYGGFGRYGLGVIPKPTKTDKASVPTSLVASSPRNVCIIPFSLVCLHFLFSPALFETRCPQCGLISLSHFLSFSSHRLRPQSLMVPSRSLIPSRCPDIPDTDPRWE